MGMNREKETLRTRPGAVHGFAAMAKGRQLEPFTYDPPELKEHEVRVSVTHCGICFSDIHAIDDFYGITSFPFVPGHEVVGHVSEVGSAVAGLRVGDRVGMGWQGRSCMKCEWCLKGEEQLCKDVEKNGVWAPHGGFASSVTADARFVYPLPESMPSEVGAVLLCAGVTVYSPLRTFKAGPSDKVCVVGVGGLGHLAIQFAHALGCEVTVISSSPGKKEQALGFGADDFVVAGDNERIKQLYYNFDLVLYTGHTEIDWTRVLWTVKTNGRLVMMGFPPANVSVDLMELVVHQQSVTGSFLGSRATMKEVLSFAQAHKIAPMVEQMPMAQANEAIQKVKENKARYRIVLVNDGGSAKV
jgi:uncharacterized zinc-type alcohol dehydrogenase-like protein